VWWAIARGWRPDEPSRTQWVVIGRDLDAEVIRIFAAVERMPFDILA